MPEERWRRIKDVFSAAVERPPEAHEAFLRETCGDDAELRQEVASLLAASRDAGVFLSRPILGPLAGAGLEEPGHEGRRIGPYRILGIAGQGGMGLVYRAVRDDDVFQKTVALKLVHGGAGPGHLQRLARERQILARLQHPNIATILDGGTTDAGQPYLVMEFVDGQPIDAYCNTRGLATRQRLGMFRTVCEAVHYAHQNLVVHRDLKPQNVLVTADGQPKLLDFGIAKLLAAGVDPDLAPTATLMPMMTPAYASPEQVRGLPVTTASDVYSLGVVLYELLTGRRPYVAPDESLEELLRAVRDTEPPLPSVAVRTATPGPTQPRSLSSELKGDLDTIVLKALRKEPERRYLSAQELAEDVRRHLEGLPVLARSDTLGYRVSKFVARHRAGVTAAVLLLASLLGGLGATVWQWRRAEANRLRAEKRFADVRSLANSFLFEFHDAIITLPGSTAARQLVVDRAVTYLDGLAQDARHDVGLRRELAVAYQRLGEAQGGIGDGNLGDTRGALASYEKALAIRRTLVVSPGDAADVEGLAHLEIKLSRVVGAAGDWPRAEEMARAAAARLQALAGATGTDLRGKLASVHHQLGYIQARRGNESAALESLRVAVATGRAYSDAHPSDRGGRANLARVESELLERLQRRGEHREAMELGRSARTILEGLVEGEPNNARYKRDLVYALNVGSGAVEAAGDPAEANRQRRRALELSEALVAAEPANQGDRIGLTFSLQTLGAGLVRAGRVQEGLERLRQAGRTAEGIVRSDSQSAFARNRLAEVRAELALALRALRIHPREMCAALHESVTLWEGLDRQGRLPGENRPDLETARALSLDCPPEAGAAGEP
jgi:non-specific serine/threonine protein kinase/serine/threonine-protein kinase